MGYNCFNCGNPCDVSRRQNVCGEIIVTEWYCRGCDEYFGPDTETDLLKPDDFFTCSQCGEKAISSASISGHGVTTFSLVCLNCGHGEVKRKSYSDDE